MHCNTTKYFRKINCLSHKSGPQKLYIGWKPSSFNTILYYECMDHINILITFACKHHGV